MSLTRMYAVNKFYPIVNCDMQSVRLHSARCNPGSFSVSPRSSACNSSTYRHNAIDSQSLQHVSSQRFYTENCSDTLSTIQLCHQHDHLQSHQSPRCPAMQPMTASESTSSSNGLKQISVRGTDEGVIIAKPKLLGTGVSDAANDNQSYQSINRRQSSASMYIDLSIPATAHLTTNFHRFCSETHLYQRWRCPKTLCDERTKVLWSYLLYHSFFCAWTVFKTKRTCLR
jgi:hypothetical protein